MKRGCRICVLWCSLVILSTNLFLAIILIESDLLARQPLPTHMVLGVQGTQLRRPVGVLLVALNVVKYAAVLAKRLAGDEGREHSLLRIRTHLPHNMIMILLIQIRNLRQPNLVTAILVLVLL